MIFDQGDKVLVVHRRLFEEDHPRYFVGTVDGYNSGVTKVTGFTWIKDAFGGSYLRKNDRRTKVFSLTSGTLLVYELPIETIIEETRFETDREGRVFLTDGKNLRMDISESERFTTLRRKA